MEELSNSIKKNGVIQPIAVRAKKNEPGKYEIVAGERRWLAAQRAGLHDIPVNILDFQIKGKPYWRVVAGPASSSDSRRSMLKTIKSAGFTDAYFISN